ncbi:MAG: NosD domain-containing protein [Candidatus Saccharimonadales bacterium]
MGNAIPGWVERKIKSLTKAIHTLAVASLVFASTLALVPVSVSATDHCDIRVGGGQDYETIQAAIDAVTTDDRAVCVEAGNYDEDILINQNGLTLESLTEGDAIIEGEIRVFDANNVTIDGFEIVGSSDVIDRGIGSARSDGLTISNNTIAGFNTGVSLQFAGTAPTNVSIVGNVFIDNEAGIGSTDGVEGLLISSNTFINNNEGIGLGVDVTLLSGGDLTSLLNSNSFEFEEDTQWAIGDYRNSPLLKFAADGAFLVHDGDTLQDVVNLAPADSTVRVGAGTYAPVGTSFGGNSGLTIEAVTSLSPTIIGNTGRLVDLRADGTTLRGFRIESTAVGSNVGVSVSGIGVTVESNRIVNTLTGIQTTTQYSVGSALISGNDIDARHGISLQNSGNTVSDNDVTATDEGLGVGSTSWVVVDNNIVDNEFNIASGGIAAKAYTSADYEPIIDGSDFHVSALIADNTFNKAIYIQGGNGTCTAATVKYCTIFTTIEEASESTTDSNDTIVVGSGSPTPGGTTPGNADLPSDINHIAFSDNTSLDLSSQVVDGPADTLSVNGVDIVVERRVQLNSLGSVPIEIRSSASTVSNVLVTIPDDTTISAPSSWNGELSPPRADTNVAAPSGFTFNGTALKVGSDSATLIFDKIVTVVLEGVEANNVGYAVDGGWEMISKCNGVNPLAYGECYEIVDGNTEILTWHFTTFAALSADPAVEDDDDTDTEEPAQQTSTNTGVTADSEGEVLGAQDDNDIIAQSQDDGEVLQATDENETEAEVDLVADSDMSLWWWLLILLLIMSFAYYFYSSRKQADRY